MFYLLSLPSPQKGKGKGADIVTVRGPAEAVDKAVEQIKKIAGGDVSGWRSFENSTSKCFPISPTPSRRPTANIRRT